MPRLLGYRLGFLRKGCPFSVTESFGLPDPRQGQLPMPRHPVPGAAADLKAFTNEVLRFEIIEHMLNDPAVSLGQ